MGMLQQELKQRKPFRSQGEEAILNIWHTGDFLWYQLQQLLKTHGITQPQYNVLRILRGAGTEGLPCSEIVGRMLTLDPDVTRLLDRLARAGLARRTRNRRDRRVVLARITPRGSELLERLETPVAQLIDGMTGHIGSSRLKLLVSILEAVRKSASHA
jgi:DNA-binding MarR family transcriptional regulator